MACPVITRHYISMCRDGTPDGGYVYQTHNAARSAQVHRLLVRLNAVSTPAAPYVFEAFLVLVRHVSPIHVSWLVQDAIAVLGFAHGDRFERWKKRHAMNDNNTAPVKSIMDFCNGL